MYFEISRNYKFILTLQILSKILKLIYIVGIKMYHILICDAGDFDGRCISSPYACTEGITLSLWMRLLDTYNMNNTESNPNGVGYILR